MTVRMYSTRIYTAIEAEVGERYGVTPNKRIYNDSPECSGQTGGPGFTIDVARVFYEGDEEVNRETFTTTYAPAPEVVCGKKPDKDKDKDKDENGDDPSPSPTPTDGPAPEPTAEPTPESTPESTEGAGTEDVSVRGTAGRAGIASGDTVGAGPVTRPSRGERRAGVA
jgi:hypothetical protein